MRGTRIAHRAGVGATQMTLIRLSLTDFRNHAGADLAAGPGLVALHGDNGAGKTNILEAISLLAGYYGVFILKRTGISDNAINVLRLFALVFFIVFALELLYKGIKNDPISEKRADEVHFKPLMKSLGRISIHTLFESISFSFCDTRFSYVLVIPLVSSVLATLSALWAGYHLGFEVKSKAYIIGFVLIMLGVAETIFRFVI